MERIFRSARVPLVGRVVLLLVLCLFPSAAHAQASLSPPTNLASALQALSWDAGQRGPLLVVDPWHVVRTGSASSSDVGPSGSQPGSRNDLKDIAEQFGLNLTQQGDVTALAPPEMVVLNTDPGPPNVWEGLDRGDRMRLLESTLTQTQWGQIGGVRGLGLSDLAPEQQGLFLSLLPKPFPIKQATIEKSGAYSIAVEPVGILSDDERSQVRLRLTLATRVSPVPRAGAVSGSIQGGASDGPAGTQFLFVNSELGRTQSRGGPFGVALQSSVPNRLKPGQLPFTSPVLSASVSLLPAYDQQQTRVRPLTVGELVRRVGQAARLELYADARVADLPVWARGQAAPAGDVLRALCLSLTSAFRQVGPAFVLTDDVQGIGARRALLTDWLNDAKAKQQEQLETAREIIASQLPLEALQPAAGDPLSQNPKLAHQILSGCLETGADSEVAIADLPAVQQGLYRRYIGRALDQGQPFRADRIHLGIDLRLSYLAPRLGELTDLAPSLGSLASMTTRAMAAPDRAAASAAPIAFPPRLASRILYVTPHTSEEATRLVSEAHRRGMTQFWVDLPERPDAGIIAAAITAGKENGLPIFAVVHLLRRAPGEVGADINIRGETSSSYAARRLRSATVAQATMGRARKRGQSAEDWARADAPQTVATSQAGLASLAATPGLAGIVVRDTAAPGYEFPRSIPSPFSIPLPEAAGDLGYTPAARLAFLRRTGVDPLDITASAVGDGGLSLPFYPDLGSDSGRAREWKAYRYGEAASLLRTLYASLRAGSPSMPLVIAERGTTAWYGSWDGPSALPVLQSWNFGQSLALLARAQSRRVFLTHAGVDEETRPAEYRQGLERMLKGEVAEGNWDGVVFDMSQVSEARAVSLLGILSSAEPSAAAERSTSARE